MKIIQLTKNKVAIVDDQDYELVIKFKWSTHQAFNLFYAKRSLPKENGKRKTLFLHRFLLEINDPKLAVDHKDGNGLNNRRDNLRIVTHQENMINRKKSKNNTGFKGVYWRESTKKFNASITVNGKRKYLGSFENAQDATNAYETAAKELFGVFRRIE